jgi:hypothetical protein
VPLDAHILDSDAAQPVDWPACQFEEPIHSAIFFGGSLELRQYPLLRRMQDYYADAKYSGADLRGLVGELQIVLPKFARHPEVYQIIQCFLELCRNAASQEKVVLCLCD